MPDVFVSYKRENEAKVAKLVAALEAQGLDIWWDRDIPPGAPWEATIEEKLGSAKAVIVCWSRAAVASENVRSEARLARNQGRLIQAFLEPCEPPLFFGERQGVDLAGWRGKVGDPRVAALAGAARSIPAGVSVELPKKAHSKLSRVARRGAIAIVFALLFLLAAGWFFLKPMVDAGPITLAVLPFRAMSAGDANLGDAIADDTRSAIGHNPNLRVLGRVAVSALAEQAASPQDYRKKLDADYLLDGSVERSGARLKIKVSLVRAKDAAEVWADQLDGKIDDVFAFQGRIAREVEGRIRGRLAPNKGIKAANITTSGEVYAIYAEARALTRNRNRDDGNRGIELLRKAVAMDPNFAPAWAELGAVVGRRGGTAEKSEDETRAEAVGYLKRALTLAPNLAFAHGALAMVQKFPPELMPEIKKAVQLDPNDADLWNWLGNSYGSQNKVREAVAADRRANEIDPLLTPPIGNLIGGLVLLGDERGIAKLLARLDRTGDLVVPQKARWQLARARGQAGEDVRLGLKLIAEHPDERGYVQPRVARTLIQLGFIDQGLKAFGWDPQVASDFRGVPPSAASLRSFARPIELWLQDSEPMLLARMLPNRGRFREFIGYYDAAFQSTEDFYNLSPSTDKGLFRAFAPNVAVLLRAAGRTKEAEQILDRDEQLISGFLNNGPPDDYYVDLAQLRAAQGRDDGVVPLLDKALAAGWLPDRQFTAIDIAQEPCFAGLVGRADFQRLRQRILARIEEERRIAAPAVAAAKF